MEKKELSAANSSVAFLIGFLVCQFAVVIGVIIGTIFAALFGAEFSDITIFFNSAIGYLISSLLLDLTMVLIFIRYKKTNKVEVINKPSATKILLYVLLAVASFLTLYPIVTCVDSWLYNCGLSLNTIPFNLNTPNYFISLLSLVLLPAIGEELLFRGIIQSGLKKHGKIFSIVLTAFMFSLFHMAIDQTVYPWLMGLLLSVIMYYENNIIYTIIIHAVNNFLSLTLAYFNINLVFNHWTYILLAVVLLIIFISIILFFTIKGNKESKAEKLTKYDKTYLAIALSVMSLLWILINLSNIITLFKSLLNL